MHHVQLTKLDLCAAFRHGRGGQQSVWGDTHLLPAGEVLQQAQLQHTQHSSSKAAITTALCASSVTEFSPTHHQHPWQLHQSASLVFPAACMLQP
jgi:hypothetical protein